MEEAAALNCKKAWIQVRGELKKSFLKTIYQDANFYLQCPLETTCKVERAKVKRIHLSIKMHLLLRAKQYPKMPNYSSCIRYGF